jgi:MFS family permease
MVGALSALFIGLGMFGLAFMGQGWHSMILFMTIWSIGAHLMMPIKSSVSMNLAKSGEKGKMLGRIQGVGIASSIIGCLVVWGIMKYAKSDYSVIFIIGGLVGIAAAASLFLMRLPEAHLDRPKFVWNRKYSRYYVLQLLFGARKQVFITFGPWVLVKIFNQPVWIFAQLWIAASVIGLVFQPALGRAIDRFGERTVLTLDGVFTFAVCLGYAFAHRIPSEGIAVAVLYVCLVGDQLLFGTGMARDIYLSKIAVKKEEIAPTLSLGVSINHVISMSIPSLGGYLWMTYGHPSVFFAASAIALLMIIVAAGIRLNRAI